MHLLESSPEWLPYFGNQRRFVPFVLELLKGLGANEKSTFFETNAGSHAIGYHLSQELGLHVVANDLGAYSCAIGRALSGDKASLDIAARGAAIIEQYGYNPPVDAKVWPDLYDKWTKFLLNQKTAERYEVTRGDLFDIVPTTSGDFIYCDFAWPWRDGSETEEYITSSDTLGKLLGDTRTCSFSIASGRRILNDVIRFLDIARKNYRFVILSNQSSNYPTPEVLEAHIKACGHSPIISRRQTVKAEAVDNLGKDESFTEFQYVFEGT